MNSDICAIESESECVGSTSAFRFASKNTISDTGLVEEGSVDVIESCHWLICVTTFVFKNHIDSEVLLTLDLEASTSNCLGICDGRNDHAHNPIQYFVLCGDTAGSSCNTDPGWLPIREEIAQRIL